MQILLSYADLIKTWEKCIKKLFDYI